MAGFGIGTDHFGLDSATLTLIESSSTPAPVSIEQAQDADGYTVAEDSYEGGPAAELSCTYRLISGTLNLNTLAIGGTAPAPTSIEVSTSNSEWPTITVTGYDGVAGEDSWTLPNITISGKKQAQVLDFTVGENCRLTSSSLTASGEIHHALDDAGTVGATAITGANCEISAEMVEITGVCAWTPGETWIETQAPGSSNGNIAWGTASATASKMLTIDV